MNNWQNWYQAFLANKKDRQLRAFHKGLNGEPYEDTYEYPLSSESNWTDLINKAITLDHKPEFNFDNNSLIFNHELLNLALSKSIKQITLIYPYESSTINLLLFKKLSPNHSIVEFIKILREPPLEWFSECSYCEFENEEGWSLCQNCRRTFEESLED